ncbi:hypothetical protein BX600DRAFT_515366 [Xylariales sp. PMI_506]|nr:hypothetical protein BX600DRAFT_515366 [Xylariales sp. PMI_506]
MDATESGNNLPVDISPYGDIILIIGQQNMRLRIFSRCLCCASKVFSAMFSPQWNEGQGLSKALQRKSSERRTMLMHCVQYVVLYTIATILYQKVIPPLEVLQIAIATNKYDLSVALKYAIAQ